MLKEMDSELLVENLCLFREIGKEICFMCIWSYLCKMSPAFKKTGLMRMEEYGFENNEMRDPLWRKREINAGVRRLVQTIFNFWFGE